jgi:hypothetical protein
MKSAMKTTDVVVLMALFAAVTVLRCPGSALSADPQTTSSVSPVDLVNASTDLSNLFKGPARVWNYGRATPATSASAADAPRQ